MRKHGRAIINPNAPEATAYCDRCGFAYLHSDLEFQKEYSGTGMIEKQLLVCKRTCLDKPAPFLKTILIPPDPIPILNPRPLPPYQEVETKVDWDDPAINWDDPNVNWDQT